MLNGLALVQEINAKKPASGQLYFWWLGQHSFVVKTARHIFYLDPFLSPLAGRQVPPLLLPEEVTHADFITGSHNHADHIDRPILNRLLAASPHSRLVIPRAVWPKLEYLKLPEGRVRLLDDTQYLLENEVKITAIKAAHEFFDRQPLGHPYLGYVIEADGVTIYHSGDTCIFDGLATRLKAWSITVAFLPINGRDAKRLRSGCIGNMTYQEAVDLAGAIQPRLTVPAHYEMFAGNTENPALFADYLEVKFPGLKYWIGDHGATVLV